LDEEVLFETDFREESDPSGGYRANPIAIPGSAPLSAAEPQILAARFQPDWGFT
jgi:hypothetical protein